MLLALDLGLLTGWSLFRDAIRLSSGTWNLRNPFGSLTCNRARGDVFLDKVLRTVAAQRVTVLAHEHVPSLHQHAGVDAAHLFGGWLELIEMVRCRTGIRVVRVTSPEVHAVSGVVMPPRITRGLPDVERRRAKADRREELKRRVVAAAQARGWQVLNDNEADACFVGVAALAKGGA